MLKERGAGLLKVFMMDWERILLVFTDILLPIGFLIDFGRARFYYRKVISMLWLRFVIVPVLFYLLFKLLFADQVLLGSLLLMAATPAAINSVITAQLYKLNVDITIASFLLTTVVFVLVVFPLFFFYIHFGGRL